MNSKLTDGTTSQVEEVVTFDKQWKLIEAHPSYPALQYAEAGSDEALVDDIVGTIAGDLDLTPEQVEAAIKWAMQTEPDDEEEYGYTAVDLLVTNHSLYPAYRRAMKGDLKSDVLAEWLVAKIAEECGVTTDQVLTVRATEVELAKKWEAEYAAEYAAEYGSGEPYAKYNLDELRDEVDEIVGQPIPLMKLEPWG